MDKKIIATRFDTEPIAGYDWANVTFSVTDTDWVLIATAPGQGEWSTAKLIPSRIIDIDLACTALNYGQSVFEGIKAERAPNGDILIFRLKDNAKRMYRGAERLGLNPYPVDSFIESVKRIVRANARWVPPHGMGALYIRPMLFGSGPKLGVAPAPSDTFAVWVSPVGPYFKGGLTPISLLVTHEFHRAVPGGAGAVKAEGNYAPGMIVAGAAKKRGFAEVVYLDVTNTNVEEVGAANFFVVKNKVLYTPELTGTILPGITRASVIQLARDRGYKVVEGTVPIDFVMTADEAFCTGTAAVISPIGRITNRQLLSPKVPLFINRIVTALARWFLPEKWFEKLLKEYTVEFNNNEVGPISRDLYETLTALKEGRIRDPYDWVEVVVRR